MATPTVSVYANTDQQSKNPENIGPTSREEKDGEDVRYIDMGLGEDSQETVYDYIKGEEITSEADHEEESVLKAKPLVKPPLPTIQRDCTWKEGDLDNKNKLEQTCDPVDKQCSPFKLLWCSKRVRYSIIISCIVLVVYTIAVVGISVGFSWLILSHCGQYGEIIPSRNESLESGERLQMPHEDDQKMTLQEIQQAIQTLQLLHLTAETNFSSLVQDAVVLAIDNLTLQVTENFTNLTRELRVTEESIIRQIVDVTDETRVNFTGVHKEINKTRAETDNKLVEQSQRITLLETGLSNTTEDLGQATHRVDQLERDLSETKGNFEDTKQRVGQLETNDEALATKLSNAETQLNNVQTDHSQHTRRLDSHDRRLFNLERDVNRLESSGSSSPLPAFTVVMFSIAASIFTLI